MGKIRANRGHKQGRSKMSVRARRGQGGEREGRAMVKGGVKDERRSHTDRQTDIENSRNTYFYLKTNFSVRDALLLDCFATTHIKPFSGNL